MDELKKVFVVFVFDELWYSCLIDWYRDVPFDIGESVIISLSKNVARRFIITKHLEPGDSEGIQHLDCIHVCLADGQDNGAKTILTILKEEIKPGGLWHEGVSRLKEKVEQGQPA